MFGKFSSGKSLGFRRSYDIQGLINIGLNIITDGYEFFWNDSINDFTLPLPQDLTCSDLIEVKEEVREELTHLSHDYLALIDLAYDSTQNRLFEMKTIELLVEECGYQGTHLGGSRKPDGVCYTEGMNQIDRIERNTGISGAAIEIKRLLITANGYKAGTISHSGIEKAFF